MATDTPLTLSRPILASMLQSPAAPDAVLVDWLTDQQATLADVLRLYAGTPPSFTDGLPQSALALWLRTHEPGRSIYEPASAQARPSAIVLGGGQRGQVVSRVPLWQAVGDLKIRLPSSDEPPPEWLMSGATRGRFVGYHPRPRRDATGHVERVVAEHCRYCLPTGSMAVGPTLWLYYAAINHAGRPLPRRGWMGACQACRTAHWAYDDDGPERRDLKRRVLALFPNVRVRLSGKIASVDGASAYASGVLEAGPADPGGRFFTRLVVLTDGTIISPAPGRPIHIDAVANTATYDVPVSDLVPPEDASALAGHQHSSP